MENDFTYFDAVRDEDGSGDPRRCPKHGTVMSSADGMFDGLCGRCEMEADEGGDGDVGVPDPDCDDGDDGGALASVGFGTDEDYGGGGDDIPF